ncbi:MAG: hypothetical protein JXB60_09865, partial [Candidatus Cloacimonetes bacterium]|nr:hypothetical protein [Candidatus Cloacimonadota bacterium]
MKKIFILALIISTALLAASGAGYYRFADNWGNTGFNLESSSTLGAEIIYSVMEFSIENVTINGEEMQMIHLPGHFLPNEEGAPNLPGSGRYIAIPQYAVPELEMISYRTEIFTGIDLAPAPRIPLETERGPLEYKQDQSIYSRNAYYPEQPVTISQPTQIRGLDVVMAGVTPFQYNPVTRELIVYNDIRFRINFKFGNGHFGRDRLRSRWWDPIYQQIILNSGSLPDIDYNRYRSGRPDGCEYLIITPDNIEFLAWADSIKYWRTRQGILTEIVTISEVGGNTTGQIEAYINNAYNNWDPAPVAVLLLADYGTTGNTIISPTWYGGYNPCISDNIYADINGNNLPDLTFARMTAQNGDHLETMINKFIDYEKTPPLNQVFYDNPLMAGGWQTERWFILCTEIVYGYLANIQGKEPVREYAIYDGTPGALWSTASNTNQVVNYFGPDGLGYIPATPQYLNDWGGNAYGINTAINNGTFLILHRDHGEEDGWGEPAYSNSDLYNLNNQDLPFVFSINCLTGKYNMNGECFAEAFHRHEEGAVGIIAASEVSYSFVNDVYVWGMFDHMWNDFDPYQGEDGDGFILPAFASVSGKYYLQSSGWPYNTGDKATVYHLFHHHGDAFFNMYSTMPEQLTVVHDPVLLSGIDFFDVSADEGSLIALTMDEIILGTATGTGYPVSINIEPQLPGGFITVTVTKQNHFRYSQDLQIIPPEGPYVVYESYEINDQDGNGNGFADYGENIQLSLTIQNVGLEPGENINVSISSTDSYITLTDSTEFYGDIAAGGFLTQNDGFAISIHDNIPDEHIVLFNLTADNGETNWNSNFTIEAYAPLLALDDYTIDDSEGDDDGILDPGESACIIIPVYNNGRSLSPGAQSYIDCSNDQILFTYYEYELGQIAPASYNDALFYVTAPAEITIGTPFNLMCDVIAGEYTTSKEFTITVGLCLEDFESGDFSSFPWEFAGNSNWIVTTNAYEGTYCARSGTISHGQETSLKIQMYVLNSDEISFWKKVSSENTYDFLRFYIDNNEMGAWSGEQGWSGESYPVDTGEHTFKWVYEKDGSVSSGSDCGWIDYIIFPPNAIGATGFLSGMITTNPPADYTQALVTTGEYST